MRDSGNLLRALTSVRCWVRVALRGCLIATLLLALTASAQDETPSETTATDKLVESPTDKPVESPTDKPVESPTDGVGEVQEGSAETDEPRGEELEDLASETEEPLEFEPKQGLDIEEILIQGEAGGSLVKDETISVLQFDPEFLKLEGIKDIRDLSNFTPSLEIKSAFAASNPTIYIRGIGLDDFNANAASAVAIYQDGVYMQSPAGQLFQFFDVEGVEVLRGPQPTLYRNAEAGAILVHSRKPTEEFEGYLTTSYGNYNSVEVEGAVGGPIVPELLLGRVSATWAIRDGITKNRCAELPNPPSESTCKLSQPGLDGTLQYDPGMDEWTNDVDAWAARGQLLLNQQLPESEIEWLLNLHGGQNKSRAYQYQHRGARFPVIGEIPTEIGGRDQNGYWDKDGDFFAGDYNIDGPEDIDLFGANLAGSWQFGDGYELTSLSAYEWHDLYRLENTDAGPKFVLESEYEDTAWQLSEQLELHGEWGSLLNTSEFGDGEWTIGGYYLMEDLEVGNFFDTISGTPQHLTQEYTQEMWNFAGYALSEYRFRPGCSGISCDFTLLGGVRYNVERKKFDTTVCEQAVTECDTSTLSDEDEKTRKGWAGEVSLAWNFTEDSSLFVKYSHGWKGGHFNGGATTVFDVITGIDPETVDSYEGGLRSLWFDDRVSLNLSAFYYDYHDLQVFIIEQTPLGYPIPKLVNAQSAEIYGVELDFGAEPLPGLNLTYNFAFVESEYADFSVTFTEKVRPPRPCRTCPRPDPVILEKNFDYTGNPLIGSPRFSMTGSISYELPLPGTLFNRGLGTLTPRFSFSWKDDIFFDACSGRGQRCNFPEAFFGQEAFWVLNAAITWRSENELFEVSGWVHNFLDESYKTQNFDLTRGLGIILDVYADPRVFGITATLSF